MGGLAKYKNKYGITLTEVLIVTVIMGIISTIAVPNFMKARNNLYKEECIVNLRRIATAKEHYALETPGIANNATPSASQLDPYVKDGTSSLVCPIDPSSSFTTSYNIGNLMTSPTCKIDGVHVIP